MTNESLLGRVIDGKYRIDAEIGAGGMAVVYRAMRLHIGDMVALKVLHSELLRDPLFAERFRREAQTAARLKHPNVVAIYDFGATEDGMIYVVMELVEGPNLRSIIKDGGPLSAVLAAEIIEQVCAALAEAHRQHIVHRDLKPANIVVETTPDGPRVKVLDFGIATLSAGATTVNLTQTGTLLGTPAYMSPEQCLGEELDGRSDIYSAGVVLFEMLCGVVPFNSPTATAVIVQHVRDKPPPLRVLNVSVSPAVEAVALRALAKRREDRPQTARALAEELAAAAGGPELSLEPPRMAPFDQGRTVRLAATPPPHASDGVLRANARRHMTVGVLVGLGAAAVLIGGSFAVQQTLTKQNERARAVAHAPPRTVAAQRQSPVAVPALPRDAAPVAPVPFTEVAIPSASPGPVSITTGPDGSLWFAEMRTGRYGRVTSEGVATEFSAPTSPAFLMAITSGPDGTVWVAEEIGDGAPGKLIRKSMSGEVSELVLPPAWRRPNGIAVGPDGALWVTLRYRDTLRNGMIGRITTSGEYAEFELREDLVSDPNGITVGPDGALWFTETVGYPGTIRGRSGDLQPATMFTGGKIGRITTTGSISLYTVPRKEAPYAITAGPDGTLWFSTSNNNKLGRISTNGEFTEFTLRPPISWVWYSMVIGKDGALWFSDYTANAIRRMPVARLGRPQLPD
jgi:streptogramin lyase/tRNA A-37 threonylcarbamoyl transferase component Bud32